MERSHGLETTMRRTLLITLFAATASACFSFSDSVAVSPGETARVTVGIVRPLSDGATEPIEHEGLVVASSLGDDSGGRLLLEQRRKETAGQFREVIFYDTLRIVEPDVERLQVRRFSWLKSGAGTVALSGFLYLLWNHFQPDAGR